MTTKTCLVCGHVGLDCYLDILLKCPTCGFVTANIDPSTDVRSLYEGQYFKGEEYLDYQTDEALFKKTFRARLNQLLKRRAGGRLLEIGAAYGFFLDLAKEHFEVIGYEINHEAAEFARSKFSLDVSTDDFLEASLTDIGRLVDVTVMWDAIEHLERPDLFIKQIADLSKPGGLLYITTGDIGSLIARLRGCKWRMIHPPSHLHYFNRQTLTRLLNNHGFEVLETRPVAAARSFRQILYSILILQLGMPGIYDTLKRVIPTGWGFRINTFDIMQMVAQRR